MYHIQQKMKLYQYFLTFLYVITYSEIHGQVNTMNNFKDTVFVLDAHSHHGFPTLIESDVVTEMAYLNNLGYDAIVFLLPQNRTKTNELSTIEIAEDIKRIEKVSLQGNSFHLYKIS